MSIYHGGAEANMVDVDRLLLSLAEELADEEVEGTYLVRIWAGVGLQIAAQLIERKRIALLCEGILNDDQEGDQKIV
jgi:hypothetical protein